MKRFLFPLFFLLLFAVSCDKDLNDTPAFSENEGEETEIEFSVKVPATDYALQNPGKSAQMRSISPEDENLIDTLYLLSFVEQSGTSLYRYSATAVFDSKSGTDGEYQKFRAKVRIYKGVQQNFVLIANAGNIVRDLVSQNNLVATGGKKSELLEQLNYAVGAGQTWNAVSSSNFKTLPMWGETTEIITASTTTPIQTLNVNLLRMVARIDVQLKLGATSKPFKITSVRLYNANTSGRIVPNGANLAADKKSVTAPTLPDAVTKNANPLIYYTGSPADSLKRTIYTFETAAPAVTEILEATGLVIGGFYDNNTADTTYYRADFVQNDEFIDILRNHIYLVNIVAVNGNGYDDPDIAWRSKPVNLELDVIAWDDDGGYNIAWDSQFWLSASRNHIDFYRYAECQEMYVYTDYITGWELETPLPEWIESVTPATGRVLENEKVTVCVKDNPSTTESRIDTIWFSAGRLRCPVVIRQSPQQRPTLDIKFQGITPPTSSNKIFGTDDEVIFKLEFEPSGHYDYADYQLTWTPKDLGIVTLLNKVSGYDFIHISTTPDIFQMAGTKSGLQNFSLAPLPKDSSVIKANPFYERRCIINFVISDNITTFEKQLMVREIYYNIITDALDKYPLDNNLHSFNIRSNTSWKHVDDYVERGGVRVPDLNKDAIHSISIEESEGRVDGVEFAFKFSTTDLQTGDVVFIVFEDPSKKYDGANEDNKLIVSFVVE